MTAAKTDPNIVLDSGGDNALTVYTENLINGGGVIKMTWKSTDFYLNFEKLTITNRSKTENDETPIMFVGLVGVNL